MRHLKADWKNWSVAERVLAIVMMMSGVLAPTLPLVM